MTASLPAAHAHTAPQPRTGAWSPAHLARAYPATLFVLALGLLVRAILVPITHGNDFVVWDLASRATLAGSNIYAHHPKGYPGGPYTYVPLFLYAELPFQWMDMHTGISFVVLGKLPIVAGDLLAALLIADYLRRRDRGDVIMAVGAALYFLNPLVLYNGAFYGRFDTFCVGLFLLALRFYTPPQPRSWRFPLLYALAVAAKTFPIFIAPWLLIREPARRGRLLLALVAVLGGLSLPYLLTSPGRFFSDTVLYNSRKLPGNLSWQVLLLPHSWAVAPAFSPETLRLISYGFLVLFLLALWLFARLDLLTYCAVAPLLFIVLSKVAIEQYYLWPMPFLIVDAVQRRSWASAGLLALLSATGTLVNPFLHPFGQEPLAIIVAVCVCIVLYIVTRRPHHEEAPAPVW